jgi:hypothetical protein
MFLENNFYIILLRFGQKYFYSVAYGTSWAMIDF